MKSPLPRRPRAHVLEELSRQQVKDVFPAEWICRRVEDDFGLDMRVEIVVSEEVTGLEFSVQLKATDQLKTSGDDVLHRCKISTAHYFLHRPEPVMYVVYDAQKEAAYWLWVQPYLRQLDKTRPGWRDQKTVQIRIPRANRLTPESIPTITDDVRVWWACRASAFVWEYAPSPQAARRPFQLPLDLPTFTGREDYLAQLEALLQPDAGQKVGLVGLCGMAGVGKSELAVHAAHKWGDRFRDGVVWVDLRRWDVASALRHVAATYGYGDQAAQVSDAEGLAALVRTVLREREALLILDNAEDVPLDQFPLLLADATGCVTLVTSLCAFTELIHHGRVLRVGQMAQQEAEALLARILGPGADEADEAARGRLVERLGGLPLALDIAARRMVERGWDAAEYLARLEGAPNLVAELNLPLTDRCEESVALAFALSYQALDEGQQRLFRMLGSRAKGGIVPTIGACLLGVGHAEVERGLEELAALSLVRPSTRPEPGRKKVLGYRHGVRYEVHPLLADYSRALERQAQDWRSLWRTQWATSLTRTRRRWAATVFQLWGREW